MNRKHKNLLFQFIEKLYSGDKMADEIHKKERELYERPEKMELENSNLTEEIYYIMNLTASLNSDIKYRYYKYGVIAEDVGEITNFEWDGS